MEVMQSLVMEIRTPLYQYSIFVIYGIIPCTGHEY